MDSLYSALKNHANVKDEKQFNPINPISELLFQKQKKKRTLHPQIHIIFLIVCGRYNIHVSALFQTKSLCKRNSSKENRAPILRRDILMGSVTYT